MAAAAERGEDAHSTLGGSVIALIEICPGSYHLSHGMPNTAGRHARVGSLAHDLAAICLMDGGDPADYLGDTLPKYPDLRVDAEMVEHVRDYITYCRSEVEPGDVVLIEARFDLDELGEDAEGMFGSADFVRLRPSTGHLLVVDFKYGSGVPVEIHTITGKPNRQTLYYAIGAVLRLQKQGHAVKRARLVIHQPRAPHPHGPVRAVDVTAIDLLDWMGDLLEISRRARDPAAPLTAGHHCREKFCKAMPLCPEHAKWVVRQAQLEFSDKGLAVMVRDPRMLSLASLTAVLDAAPAVTAWINACQEFAHSAMERGEQMPGWKLVDKRATRRWSEPEPVVVGRLRDLGLTSSQCYEHSLISPAKAEDLLPKETRKSIGELVVKQSSGTTLAKESDNRPAVKSGPAGDFTPVSGD